MKRPDPPKVMIAHPICQPSKAELNEGLGVDATFEEVVQALAQPVRIHYVLRPSKSPD